MTQEYPKVDLPEVAEKRPGEEGYVENVGEAYQRAHEIKKLSAEKIDMEFERLMAMKQFPGLDDEVKKAVDKIIELYNNAEAAMEGKKYADSMKFAFDEVAKGNAPEVISAVWKKEDIDDFIKFLEVKFGPKLSQAGR
jgi:hypothetical protein